MAINFKKWAIKGWSGWKQNLLYIMCVYMCVWACVCVWKQVFSKGKIVTVEADAGDAGRYWHFTNVVGMFIVGM